MKKAPIIIVCGMNHSGTSCIAKFLVDNGAYPGEYDISKNEPTPYIKYENTYFKNCCIELIKIPALKAPSNSVEKFINYINKQSLNTPIILKYPKSVYCLNTLSEIVGMNRVRTVFVMRNVVDAVQSNMNKTNASAQRMFQYYNSTYQALLSYKGEVFITAFERIRIGLDTKNLLQYCCLDKIKNNDI
ncbi:hypothetical protein [Desulfosarcina ovata]|nr:hypothetical protein [Desulfosarcina ovata]